MRNYEFKFDIWALLLFLLIMVPNIVWFAVPAQNEVLRIESVTPIVDVLSSIFQVLLIAALVLIGRKGLNKVRIKQPWSIATIALAVLYYAAWALYYSGCVSIVVIISICLLPCLAFLSYSINRKNFPAFIFGLIFTILHSIFAVANY